MSAENPHLNEVIRPLIEIAQSVGEFIVEKIIPSEAVELGAEDAN